MEQEHVLEQVLVTIRLLELILPQQLHMPIDPLLHPRQLMVYPARLEVRLDGASLEEDGEPSVEQTKVGQLAPHLARGDERVGRGRVQAVWERVRLGDDGVHERCLVSESVEEEEAVGRVGVVLEVGLREVALWNEVVCGVSLRRWLPEGSLLNAPGRLRDAPSPGWPRAS